MLGITVKTAETYRTRAMRKLGAHSVAGLVLEAVRLGLVDMDAFQSGFARALVDWGPDREVSQPRGEFHQSNRRGTAPRMNADVLWSRTQGITRQQGLCRTEVEGSPWPSPNRSRRVDGERLRSSFSGRCGTTRRSTNGAAREAQLRRSSLIRRFVGHVRIGQPPNVT